MSRLKCFLLVVFAAFFAFATGLQNDTVISWPSLLFRFSIKRIATQVHGQSKFFVRADPVVSLGDTTSVLYDAYAVFEDDNSIYKYSLVDGATYVSRSFRTGGGKLEVECSDADILLSVNSIVKALGTAKAVSTITTSDGSAISCSVGKSFQISVNGIKFGVCSYGSSGFTIFGSDLDVKVKYMKNQLPIWAPKLDIKTKKGCKKMASPNTVTSIGRSFLTGESIQDEERILGDVVDVLLRGSCTCKSTPRPCIFIHGLGVLTEKEKNLDTFDKYWGNLTDHTPCCSTTQYAMLNTVNNSWTDHFQQQKVCDRVLAASKTSKGSTISDTIIITHSMGGLMVAGAIANKKCKLASSATWVAIASPMLGSMAAEYFEESCNHETNFFMAEFVESTKLCPPDDGIKSLAYQYDSYSTPALDKMYHFAQEAYRKNVHAVMCSNSYSGIFSSYQLGFWILGKTIPHKSKQNDGMVEFHGCAGGFLETKFGDDFRKPFYVSKLNHNDLAFRAGDALLDEAKMPVKWFECLL
ncbi:unnamed protein product [Peronospora effusa]|uniref:Uncharacterized protein n=1 Tax=Peronospora effusa TaxID=542832 RepID=A0A3M6VH43_9STRA|nr:hypothetical protein DD238_006775 [Peronospora effusa]CAI5715782.1 unnamed protein product [Peronospora effusa]